MPRLTWNEQELDRLASGSFLENATRQIAETMQPFAPKAQPAGSDRALTLADWTPWQSEAPAPEARTAATASFPSTAPTTPPAASTGPSSGGLLSFDLSSWTPWAQPATPQPAPTPGEPGGSPLAPGPVWQPPTHGPEIPPTPGEPGAAPLAAGPVKGGSGLSFSQYVRAGAARRGLDPDQVAAVMGHEGPGGYAAVGRFDTGTSYGPLQLHYAGGSNPQRGMGDDFTRDTGIDLRTVDPHSPAGIEAHERAVDYALDRLAKAGDFHEWYGADPALGSRFTKVKRIPVPAPAVAPQRQSAARPPGVEAAGRVAQAFQAANGRPPTPGELAELAALGLG